MAEKITIPIGPQHPSLKEPACFTITMEGEKVVNAVVGLGYNHRGLEKACESRTYIQDLYIIERVCGICSHAHSTAFCQSLEYLAGVEIPQRAAFIRTLVAELERLHSHLLWLGVGAHEIGFDTLFMYTWRDREKVLDLLATLCGNRVNYGINTPGGCRRDLNDEEIAMIRKAMNELEEQVKYYTELALNDTILAARLSGIGKLSHDDALRLGAVGPVSRASGVPDDVRAIDPYAAYGIVPFKVITDDHCDVFGRAVVRVLEMQESIKMIRFCLDNLPSGEIAAKFPRRIPAGEVFTRVEAPRGEDTHYVRSNGTDKPDRVRVRAATEANWHAVRHMIEGDMLADVPIIIAAIDPCYSCTDRSFVVKDPLTGKDKQMDWGALRQYGIDWYRKERGVDPSRIPLPGKRFY
ncbi:MAG: nickel-dependent hydrogenase large subunit [Firmicutes bacterium]|nr:nickel-dependent hydrogenase large subunit [Bacillota bacterium]MBR6824533.1 nickel-dependent hydrogenase large subunit [Bacillota bacterium]MBR7113608.1 nickel-dependent hydrogenase large subunit [Bacillota bacterium]